MAFVVQRSPLFYALVAAVLASTACADGQDTEPAGEATAYAVHRQAYTVNDAVEIFFTDPGTTSGEQIDAKADDALLLAIDDATVSVDIAMYMFTHSGIADAIVRAHQRGVRVRFVGDSAETDNGGYQTLKTAGIDPVLRNIYGLMHDKFIVLDGTTVFTGSMNYTVTGTSRNDNNLVRIHNATIADAYVQEFEQMYTRCSARTKHARFKQALWTWEAARQRSTLDRRDPSMLSSATSLPPRIIASTS